MNPSEIRYHQEKWKFRGRDRPPFALPTTNDQESVWDYPRPPVMDPIQKTITVHSLDQIPIAKTNAAIRILETASPPTVYIPPQDIDFSKLNKFDSSSFCEWKGKAEYWEFKDSPGTPIAWSYSNPQSPYEAIKDHISFYPSRTICIMDGERVQPQKSEFYGGWVTKDIVGPFKGEPGTSGW
ncbi:hypothetical protein HDV06_004712 [Boothiomyces sp. JEL0866]|nr:hypothetical protein HDV06_004712 [Boothiomyces sp. JEL0866]